MSPKRLLQGTALAAVGVFAVSTAPLAGVNGGLSTGTVLADGGLAPPVLFGMSSGDWNLPSLIDDPFGVATPGFASGTWDVGGAPVFFMGLSIDTIPSALTFAPVPDPPFTATGTLSGELFSLPLSPFSEPFALLTGSWIADPSSGKGFFDGYVYLKPANPLLFAPLVVIGQIRGGFEDPPSSPQSPSGPDVLGSYAGRWTLTL